jgi:hypothetical protein
MRKLRLAKNYRYDFAKPIPTECGAVHCYCKEEKSRTDEFALRICCKCGDRKSLGPNYMVYPSMRTK